jgi:RNA polymerase sigma factor (sigma-70 family)
MDHQQQQVFFREAIEQHKGILFKIARSYCQDEEDRQDLIQEMMIKIWQTISRYNSQYKISTWLYRISLNVAISFYRKNSRRISKFGALNENIAEISIEDKSENERQLILLEQFISDLNELDKALIILYLEDKSHSEIAVILGISVSNVGTKIGRIKDKLKKRFLQFK